jgi:hypothetical protein
MNRPTSTKALQILLTFLFLTTVIVVSFHHHSGLRDYSTCAACKVVTDLSANETPQIFHVDTIPLFEVNMAGKAFTIYQPCFGISRQDRAPPVNSPL